jgi:hypothetical protein
VTDPDPDSLQIELPGMPEPVATTPTPFVVKGECESRMDIEADLAALIREYPDEYREADMRGFAPWERPMVFLHAYLEEQDSTMWFGKHVTEGTSNFEFSEAPRWTAERFEDLVAVCPEARIE